MPGPGTYAYKNLNIGEGCLNFTIKSRVKNYLGKYDLSYNFVFRAC